MINRLINNATHREVATAIAKKLNDNVKRYL